MSWSHYLRKEELEKLILARAEYSYVDFSVYPAIELFLEESQMKIQQFSIFFFVTIL